jgi:hypothetical protein
MFRASFSLFFICLIAAVHAQGGQGFFFDCGSAEFVEHKRILSALVALDEKPKVVVEEEVVKVYTSRFLTDQEFTSFLTDSRLDQCRFRHLPPPIDGPGATTVTESFIGIGSDRRTVVIIER